VESFGQIVLDYGEFEALLAVGKQQLPEPRRHPNSVVLSCAHANVVLDPNAETLILNGVPHGLAEYVGELQVEGSFDQLLRCIATGAQPESDAATGALGVEVLMAAYASLRSGGREVKLPL